MISDIYVKNTKHFLFLKKIILPATVSVAITEYNGRQDDNNDREGENHSLYITTQFFLGSTETLWKREFHRLDWFGPGALIYTWLRQSMMEK